MTLIEKGKQESLGEILLPLGLMIPIKSFSSDDTRKFLLFREARRNSQMVAVLEPTNAGGACDPRSPDSLSKQPDASNALPAQVRLTYVVQRMQNRAKLKITAQDLDF
jgi:hypothetical protein